MNILFITPSYKPAYVYGGPTISVSELAEALVMDGHTVTVYTTTANGDQELDLLGENDIMGVKVFYFKRWTKDHKHISPGLWKRLNKDCTHFDVIHIHSWWNFLVLGAAFICRLKGKRFFISPRGMLGGYSFTKKNKYYKSILHTLLGKPLLKGSILHATTKLEWQDCKLIFPEWQGFVLPNLIVLPTHGRKNYDLDENLLKIGFLGRIDHVKGLDILIKGFSQVKFNYKLFLGGDGSKEYTNELKELIKETGIEENVIWVGWQNGLNKFEFLESIDLLVLTSYTENFAIVVIESLLMGSPVMISDKVGLSSYVEDRDLGWVCQTSPESISEVLNSINNDKSKLIEISKRAPSAIKKDFDKLNLGKQYSNAYLKTYY